MSLRRVTDTIIACENFAISRIHVGSNNGVCHHLKAVITTWLVTAAAGKFANRKLCF